MKSNTFHFPPPTRRTHEGTIAFKLGPEATLQRSVMANLLWENSFYENGTSNVERIQAMIPQCRPEFVAGLAVTARTDMKLRHTPLLLAREMAKLPTHKHMVKSLLPQIIQRPDEISEFLAIYWKDGKQPLSAQVKKGLAKSFDKFNEYSLAKYKGSGPIKLRDALFLTHAKPSKDREDLYKRLADQKLVTPDTWEVALSSGADKKETFTRLMQEEKLGALAFLRNLRNMFEAGVDVDLVIEYSKKVNTDRVLPFRFISAARAIPAWEPLIESMMLRSLKDVEKLPGHTVLVVDNSGSMMYRKVSEKSDITSSDAACALAILLREICENVTIIGYGTDAAVIAPRSGFALSDAIQKGPGGGTDTHKAVSLANKRAHDRLILITDEQSHTPLGPPQVSCKSYCINVANYKNGIGYGPWVHIDGWSESIIEYIRAYEKELV